MKSKGLNTAVGGLLVAACTALTMIGCSGEDGPRGRSGVIPDNVPPSIALVSPIAGDTLNDTMLMAANASDNVGIRKVVYFFDGSDTGNDTGVVHLYSPSSGSLYEYTWNLRTRGVADGPHVVMARAFDLDGNVTDTPPVLIYTKRLITPGKAVLQNYRESDSTGVIGFPIRHDESTTIRLDSLWSRFTPERACTVDSLALFLDSLAFAPMQYDTLLHIALYRSNGVYPSTRVAETQLDVRGLEEVGFREVTFTPAATFAAGEKFHVLVTPVGATDTTLFALRTAVVPRYDFATDNRSGGWLDDQLTPAHWATMQEAVSSGAWTRELMIRVLVTYE